MPSSQWPPPWANDFCSFLELDFPIQSPYNFCLSNNTWNYFTENIYAYTIVDHLFKVVWIENMFKSWVDSKLMQTLCTFVFDSLWKSGYFRWFEFKAFSLPNWFISLCMLQFTCGFDILHECNDRYSRRWQLFLMISSQFIACNIHKRIVFICSYQTAALIIKSENSSENSNSIEVNWIVVSAIKWKHKNGFERIGNAWLISLPRVGNCCVGYSTRFGGLLSFSLFSLTFHYSCAFRMD